MPLFKIQLLHVLCTGILLYFQMYIIQITLATPFEQFHQGFSMKDPPLPQQAQDTKYWKDLHNITIRSGNQGAEVTILYSFVQAVDHFLK